MVGHAKYSYHAAYVSTVVIGTCILAFTIGLLIWRMFQKRRTESLTSRGAHSYLRHALVSPGVQGVIGFMRWTVLLPASQPCPLCVIGACNIGLEPAANWELMESGCVQEDSHACVSWHCDIGVC